MKFDSVAAEICSAIQAYFHKNIVHYRLKLTKKTPYSDFVKYKYRLLVYNLSACCQEKLFARKIALVLLAGLNSILFCPLVYFDLVSERWQSSLF